MPTTHNPLNTYIIAEIGVNHNGSEKMAKKLIDKAKLAGADAIKIQIFKSEALVSNNTILAPYQRRNLKKKLNQYDMLKKLELSNQINKRLFNYSKKKKIDFLTSVFDEESLEFVYQNLNTKTLKIGSGEITNGPLLFKHARLGYDIILSTGNSTIREIEQALGVLVYGYMHKKNNLIIPSRKIFKKLACSKEGRRILKKKVTLLHCVSDYPAKFEDLNINCINSLKDIFGVKVGYSDHSLGFEAAVVATSIGASVIEKHITLDKNLQGPDHKCSMDPVEFKNFVQYIRKVEKMMGTGKKKPSFNEMKNIKHVRKNLYAKIEIKKGDEFNINNLVSKRPYINNSPMMFWELLGKKSKRNFKKNDPIIF